MKKYLFGLVLLCSCIKNPSDTHDALVSMQLIDRNGFSETISNKDRLSTYANVDFTEPQPYQKVLRVYSRNHLGQSTSKITSYHDNGELCQYLEVIDGRANGIYREWFANGKLKIEAQVIEGVADIHELAKSTWVFQGPCQVWDENGNLSATFHYEKGILDSPSLYFYPDGNIYKRIPFEKGEPHGIAEVFDENGKLIEESHFSNGEKDGKSVAYWQPGSLKFEETYTEGKLCNATYFNRQGECIATVKNYQGQQAQFNQTAALQTLYTITNGLIEGEVQIFAPNGTLHCSYTLKDGMKNGEEWEYYAQENGMPLQPKICLNWSDDRIQGHIKTWYPNGQMQSQREINNNKKHGTSFAWYKSGDLMLIEDYENDLLVKGTYFKKGDKRAVSKIEAGKGIASLYTAEGIFLKKVTYDKGKPLLANDSIR